MNITFPRRNRTEPNHDSQRTRTEPNPINDVSFPSVNVYCATLFLSELVSFD